MTGEKILTLLNYSLFHNYFPHFLGLIITIAVGLEDFKNKLTAKSLAIFIYLFLGLLIFRNLLLSFFQLKIWRSFEFTKAFLPPYTDWSYFFQYTFYHFWGETFVKLMFALGALILIYIIFRIGEKQFVYYQELLMIFLFLLIIPWPTVVLFIPLVFAIGLVLAFIRTIKSSSNKKIVLRWFYPWVSLILILLSPFVNQFLLPLLKW